MSIVRTILFVILCIILILLIILLLILLIPFQYDLKLKYDGHDKVELSFNYIIFKINGFLSYKPKFAYELKLWNKVLLDSNAKKEHKKKNSISDTDFIKNKDIEKEVSESKKAIRDLFVRNKQNELRMSRDSANRDKKNIDKVKIRAELNANSFIEKFKNIIPKNTIEIIKKVVKEALNILDVIRPSSCKIDISYGTDNPYDTGLALAFAAPLYVVFGGGAKLTPSFHEEKFSGKMILKRNVMLIRLVPPVIRLLLDREFRKLVFKKS